MQFEMGTGFHFHIHSERKNLFNHLNESNYEQTDDECTDTILSLSQKLDNMSTFITHVCPTKDREMKI